MKINLLALLTFCFSLTLLCKVAYSQRKHSKNDLSIWKKAVVNIETEGYVYPDYIRDSIVTGLKKQGYDSIKLDSIDKSLRMSSIKTGTAIYIIDGNRKYLVTAKHVLFDSTFVKQKIYETKNNKYNWSDELEAIFPRISIRTPLSYVQKTNRGNTLGTYNNSFTKVIKPYIFLSDSTGDGLCILGLQDKSNKLIDTLLQINGYVPIPIEKINSKDDINEGDEIFTIGFPERISVVKHLNFQTIKQLPDVVVPFTCYGRVAMVDSLLHFYYVDLTITPGNSGSPIIRSNKIIGIVSGINKYQIITDNFTQFFQGHLEGIGHLVAIIKVTNLMEGLRKLQISENKSGFYK